MQNNIFQTVIHVQIADSKYYCLRDCKQKPTLFLLDEFWGSKPLISRRNSQASRGTSVFGRPEAHIMWENCGFILNHRVLSSFFSASRKPLHMKNKKLKDSHFETWDLDSCKGRTKTWMLFSHVLQFHHFGWYKFKKFEHVPAEKRRGEKLLFSAPKRMKEWNKKSSTPNRFNKVAKSGTLR